MAEFREAIRIKNYAAAHSNLGAALVAQGQYDAAITEFREAIRLKPGDAEVHYNLGGALKKTAQNAEASREFVEAHRLDPRITPPIETIEEELFRLVGGCTKSGPYLSRAS
jgi:Flp pilus assembly protein TadD